MKFIELTMPPISGRPSTKILVAVAHVKTVTPRYECSAEDKKKVYTERVYFEDGSYVSVGGMEEETFWGTESYEEICATLPEE